MANYIITGSSGDLSQHFIKSNYKKSDYYFLLYNKNKPKFPYPKKFKNFLFLKVDFSKPAIIEKTLNKINKTLLPIDFIISFAGSASPHKKLNSLKFSELNKIYNINLFSPLILFNYFINLHIKKKTKKKIKIINISTTSKGSLYSSHYSHSKKSLNYFLYKLSEFYSKNGIIINTISPGYIDNNMYKRVKLYNKSKFKKSKIPNFLNRRGKNEDVTNLIKFMVEKNTGFINGKNYEIDGGS